MSSPNIPLRCSVMHSNSIKMNFNYFRRSANFVLFLALTFMQIADNAVLGGALQLTSSNVDMTLASNELVIINFYADWCKFSNLLEPVFNDAAEEVKKVFTEPGRIILGKVDCDQESSLASRFHITKYPTLKVFRNGQPAKREYRGQRSVEAFVEYAKKQLEDPIKEFHTLLETHEFDKKARVVIGYFPSKEMNEYKVFRRVASNLKDDCRFHVGFGEVVEAMHPPGSPIVVFRPDHATPETEHETYNGSLNVFDELNIWLTDKCVPLVREITFENAEELTEEGLPFLILFHKPDDVDTVKLYKEIILQELISEKSQINFLTADGDRFAHPLHHLGKSPKDLPLIAIDSFRHMYMFPKTSEMSVPGKLKEFVQDLYSGKLHREYHFGPDSGGPIQVIQLQFGGMQNAPDKQTAPPESTFKKLAPSKNRYTLLRDEL